MSVRNPKRFWKVVDPRPQRERRYYQPKSKRYFDRSEAQKQANRVRWVAGSVQVLEYPVGEPTDVTEDFSWEGYGVEE